MNELWDKYYAEYIQKHKSDGKDVFQLTNEAISYCMKKLGLKQQRSEREKKGMDYTAVGIYGFAQGRIKAHFEKRKRTGGFFRNALQYSVAALKKY